MFPSTAILLRLLTALVHSLFAGEAISSLSSLPSASVAVERAAIQWRRCTRVVGVPRYGNIRSE